MDDGALVENHFSDGGHDGRPCFMGRIATAMSHSPFLFIEALPNVNDGLLKRHLFVPKVASIPTSLPLSLRYYNAASLPLGLKTRLAHIAWCRKFEVAIGYQFSIDHYRSKARNAAYYANVTSIVDQLTSIEEKIVLNEDEA
jgi:hypothetical protein